MMEWNIGEGGGRLVRERRTEEKRKKGREERMGRRNRSEEYCIRYNSII